MADRHRILITGVTGTLGRQFLKLFLSQKDKELILLIRDRNQKASKDRYINLKEEIMVGKKPLAKVRIISGDVTKRYFGLHKKNYDRLCLRITEIYHCAALTDFNKKYKEVRLVNFIGTKNILLFAKKCVYLKKLNYISTVFVAGNGSGVFKENDLNIKQKFNNPYEKSKFEAEIFLRNISNKKFSIAIFRPSVIVGEFSSARASSFQMFYQYFRSLSLNLISILPISPKSLINIIPCDLAAKAILLLSQNNTENATYHIVSPFSFSIQKLTTFASQYIGFKEPQYVSADKFNFKGSTSFERKLIKIYLPFLNFGAKFSAKKTQSRLKCLDFVYPRMDQDFVSRLFDFAIEKEFIVKNYGASI